MILDISAQTSDVDLDAVFKTFAIPLCYKKCLGGFEENLEALLLLTDTVDNFHQLCEYGALHNERCYFSTFRNYQNATACVKRSFCPLQPVYTVLTSGAEELCVNQAQFLADNEACLRQNIDQISQGMPSVCHVMCHILGFSL